MKASPAMVAVVGFISGVTVMLLVLLLLSATNISNQQRKLGHAVETICGEIDKGRKYSQQHVPNYSLSLLDCHKLSSKALHR